MSHKIVFIFLILAYLFTCPALSAQDNSTIYNVEFMNDVNAHFKETTKILILEKPQKSYRLEIKNGQPYNGYLVTKEKLLGELPFVDYYEDGKRKTRYTVDFIAKDQYQPPIEYALKTTYIDGNIWDGNDYRMVANQMLLTDVYKNGQKKGLNIDVFGMHYFNRISMLLEGESLHIHSLETGDGLQVYQKNGYVIADYLRNGKKIATSTPLFTDVAEATPKSSTIYYVDEQKQLQQMNWLYNARQDLDSKDHILMPLFMQFSFKFNGPMDSFLSRLDILLSNPTEAAEGLENVFESFMVPYTLETLIGSLIYDEEGKPQEGIYITKNVNNTYTIKSYKNGSIVKESITNNLKKLLP